MCHSGSLPLRLILLLLLLTLPSANRVMTSSQLAMTRYGDRVPASKVCHLLESPDGGVTVRCSGQRLTQVCVRGFHGSWGRWFLMETISDHQRTVHESKTVNMNAGSPQSLWFLRTL